MNRYFLSFEDNFRIFLAADNASGGCMKESALNSVMPSSDNAAGADMLNSSGEAQTADKTVGGRGGSVISVGADGVSTCGEKLPPYITLPECPKHKNRHELCRFPFYCSLRADTAGAVSLRIIFQISSVLL